MRNGRKQPRERTRWIVFWDAHDEWVPWNEMPTQEDGERELAYLRETYPHRGWAFGKQTTTTELLDG